MGVHDEVGLGLPELLARVAELIQEEGCVFHPDEDA